MKFFTPTLIVCLACILLSSIDAKANNACIYSSLTLDQVTQNQNGTYDISMTFCAGGGYDFSVQVTDAFGFLLEGGASILNFPSILTSPQTNADYDGFLYNNSTDSLIYYDATYQYLGWTCTNYGYCGPLAPVCQTITITTDILPSKITCGGMEGNGVIVAPYSCTGSNLEVYPNPNFPPPPAPCSTFTLVADAGSDQDVLYTFNNSECTSLTVNSTGNSTPPLNYAWSSGQSSSTISVCPSSTTLYTVTITDGEGCTTFDDVVVNVTDISCGNNKVLMCKPNGTTTKCIRTNKVNSKLNIGWTLGSCSTNNLVGNDEIERFTIHQSLVEDNLEMEIRDFEDEFVIIRVFTFNGQLVKRIETNIIEDNELINMNLNDVDSGLYVVSLFDQDGLVSSEKIIKR